MNSKQVLGFDLMTRKAISNFKKYPQSSSVILSMLQNSVTIFQWFYQRNHTHNKQVLGFDLFTGQLQKISIVELRTLSLLQNSYISSFYLFIKEIEINPKLVIGHDLMTRKVISKKESYLMSSGKAISNFKKYP